MSQQMKFDIPARTALGRGDFYVTESNSVALGLVDTWPEWPSGKLMLVGPHGSGKTHLSHVWCVESGGQMVASRDLTGADIQALCEGPVCVEDVERVAGEPDAEEALFHLHNLALANGHTVLMTAATSPSAWQLGLPDLASRMQGTALVALET